MAVDCVQSGDSWMDKVLANAVAGLSFLGNTNFLSLSVLLSVSVCHCVDVIVFTDEHFHDGSPHGASHTFQIVGRVESGSGPT